MNYIDIIILVPALWLGYMGFRKGFVIELATLLALIGGVFAGIKLSNYLTGFLSEAITSEYLPIVSFSITFLAVAIFVFILGRLLEKAIKVVALGLPNRIFGALFGLVKAFALLAVLVLIVEKFNEQIQFISQEKINGSALYSPLVDICHKLLPAIDEFKEQQTISAE
jgi:membrane protein required for colicin V production